MEISNEELESAVHFWLEHYIQNGEKHYSDTSDSKLVELYFDNIVERVLSDLPEMTDEENEKIVERIGKMI